MKIGRNDPCPCGSGKKYKKCCLNKENPANRQDRKKGTWKEAEVDHSMIRMEGMLPFGEPRTPEEQIEALEDILKRCPEFYPAGLDLGIQLLIKGELEESRRTFDKFLKMMKVRNEKGEVIGVSIKSICEILEEYFCFREAIEYYEMISDLDVYQISKAVNHSDIANCWYYIGDLDRALEEAERSVSIAPDNSKTLWNLGRIRMARKELPLAKETLEKAVEIDPDNRIVQGYLRACNVMLNKNLNDWMSFLTNGYDAEAVERMEEEEDYENAERERESYNENMIEGFRWELAMDDKRTYLEKHDIFFSLTYALNILKEVLLDQEFLLSDILAVETSMDRFLARLIITTGDIDDEIFDENINALLEFYRFLESKDIVDDLSDLEDEVDELRDEFREKMHTFNIARQTGDPDIKMRARDKIFGSLYWL
ncbi:MAG: SEC-C metal-binding domain-containing protein [Thermoplasmatota archaeon]